MQEDFDDDSIHAFTGHQAGVYAVAWSPTSPDLVATGGSDDTAFLWHVGQDAFEQNQGEIKTLKGHTDTISSISFSKDGTLVATGGMDGCVKVWNPADGSCIQSLEGPGEAIEWVRWHPRGNVILAGSADFTAWMWLAATGACMQVFTGHAGPVTCGGFTADGKLIVTGGGEGDASLRIWDPKSGECKHVVQGGHYHEVGLTCLALSPDSNLAVSGSEDGTLKVVALETGRIVNNLTGHDEGESIEASGFVNGLPHAVLATAGLDGKLILWDVTSGTARATCQHPDGLTRLAVHPSQPLVFTACLDGVVRCWDARTGACVHTWRGAHDAVQDLAVSPDGNMVLSGSEDGLARVFSLLET